MLEIIPYQDIFQIKMARDFDGKPLYTSAAYLLDGLLIDTGLYHVQNELREVLPRLDIQQLVNTHHHEDHIGNNSLILDYYKIPYAYAHKKAVPLIENPDTWVGKLKAYQKIALGEPDASSAKPLGEEIKTKHYTFQVIHTPGHSIDHICLLEVEQGWLFTGDIFITDKPAVTRRDEDVNVIIKSLEKLLKYDFDIIFCGTGRIVEDGKDALQRRYDNFIEIKEAVIKKYKEGIPAEVIRDDLLGKENRFCEISEGDLAKINLINSIISAL